MLVGRVDHCTIAAAYTMKHRRHGDCASTACIHAFKGGLVFITELHHAYLKRRIVGALANLWRALIAKYAFPVSSPTPEDGADMLGVVTNPSFALETACLSVTQTSL